MADPTPTPLTDAEWERLRVRIAFCGWERAVAITDDLAPVVADLLAAARADERDTAHAEVARSTLREADLVRTLDAYRDGADDIVAERDAARAEVAALRERVEAVLAEAPHVNCPDTCTCWQRRVRAALTTGGDE